MATVATEGKRKVNVLDIGRTSIDTYREQKWLAVSGRKFSPDTQRKNKRRSTLPDLRRRPSSLENLSEANAIAKEVADELRGYGKAVGLR